MISERLAAERVVLYALGGGSGHFVRALVLARAARSAVVFHRAGACAPMAPGAHVECVPVAASDAPTSIAERIAARAADHDVLVTDTFAGGLDGELTAGLRGRFRRRILVRRYVRPGSYRFDVEASRYDERWLPYARARCEWGGRVDGEHVGPIVRHVDLSDGTGHRLVVVGARADVQRDVALRARLGAIPADATWIEGPFSALPCAARYLGLGAGYNLVHELSALGVDFRVIPRERRFDDQHRRAGMFGAAVVTIEEVARWSS
ncbi:hypothetical protein L6R52_15060 [Myxococcota bacterium]|nr:hypothetical protein [Myxococcota bacterium]